MDISSGNGYPSSALSNFAGHSFIIEGIPCSSMEGFLQGLKFKNPEMQKHVCTLVGKAAKFKGKNKKWWTSQTLYWKGEAIDRHSDRYQELLTNAYDCMFEQSESFRKALEAAAGATLTHSIGKNDAHRTVLTETEFIRQLNRLRGRMK